MSLAELLPAIRALPKAEQVALLHLLVDGVAEAPAALNPADVGIPEEMRKYLPPPGTVIPHHDPVTTDAAGTAKLDAMMEELARAMPPSGYYGEVWFPGPNPEGAAAALQALKEFEARRE